MKHCFIAKQRTLLLAFFVTAACTLSAFVSNAQTAVDCSVSTNCATAYCNFAANIERGCRCFDGIDNDGDGVIDKADSNCATYYGLTFVGEGSNCSIVPPGNGNPFDLINAPITSAQNTADTQSKVSVGDIDGDGIPDAVITSKWNSEIRVVATRAPQADGTQAGAVKSDFNLSGAAANAMFSEAPSSGPCKPNRLLFEHENLIADVINKDGKAELYAVVSNRGGNPQTPPTCFYLVGFTYAPGDLVPLFKAVPIGTDRPGTFGVADMDGDGKGEIYLRDRIYAAETGALLASAGGDWDLDVTSAPVAVNISGSSVMELVSGTKIYSIPPLTNRNPATPGVLTLLHDMNTIGTNDAYVKLMNDPVEYGIDTHSSCSVADVDRDGNIDVVISGALNSVSGPTTVFYWNVVKNTVSIFSPPDPTYANGWVWGTGRVNLGDANGDGKTDFSFIAGSKLWCLTTDASGNLVPLWASPRTINDTRSGVLTVTIYDFDNDGQPEMVYRDSQILAVIDGATGTNLEWSSVCQSHTYTEGPIIADVNGDGGTDICVTCNTSNSFDINDGLQQQALGQFRLYYSAANDWLPTRKVWNQPGYFVVNIKDNLQLPFPQLDQNLVYSNAPCPNGLPGPQMPMNVFLNQVPYLSASGCPVFPAPDLSFTGDDPANLPFPVGDPRNQPAVEVIAPICGNEAIQVRFRIINDGDLPLTLNVPVSFWKADPRLNSTLATDRLYTTNINISNLAVDGTLLTNYVPFNGTGGTFRLYIVLNNAGNVLPINTAAPSSTECRLDNNIYSVDIVPDPFTTTITKVSDNFKCANSAPNTGVLEVRIFKAAIEDFDYNKYSFQWYSGLPTGTLTLLPGQTGRTATGLPEGDYTALVTNIINNCTGQYVSANIIRTGVDPDVIITAVDQTLCNPPNGSLTATVQGVGGNTGYTFEWYDNSLANLFITGSVAANMSAGNYKLIVTKDGCPKQFDAPPILPPNKPDAEASVLTNVIDCINPNSGSITADAVFNAIKQNPANYTFNWYQYNNSNGTVGSIIPPINGGQTRVGLGTGYYQVRIVDNVTQCEANQRPVVQITSQTVLPTASIARTAENTSCDPLQPNGALTASASGGTFVSPNDFTFEWFRGPNTDPLNKLPKAGFPETISGAKGEILSNAKGGGTIYTVKVTTPLNCSATFEQTVVDNINVPVLTLVELTPNSVCDVTRATNPYNGSIQASVTFAGSTVVLPDPNYKFTWYDGTTTATPHLPAPVSNQTPILAGLEEGNYAATVERTDLFCLSVPKTVPVTPATILPILSATSTGSNNCDPALTPDGTVTVTVTNTVLAPGPFTYQWYTGNVVGVSPLGAANNGTTPTAIKVGGPVGAPNPYTVEVLNTSTGCVNNTTQFVADVSVIPVLSFGLIKPNTICDPLIGFNGEMNVQVDNIPAGYTIADYTFNWKQGQPPGTAFPAPGKPATPILANVDAGFYTVDALNTKTGCPSAPISNQVPNGKINPMLQASSTGSNNCDPALTPDGTASYIVTNIQAGDAFTQQWYNGSTVTPGQQLPAANNGTSVTAIKLGGPVGAPKPYTVFVRNTVTGCTNFTTAGVADVSVVPVVTTGVSPNSICDLSLGYNGSFTANVSNIPALYTLADYDFTFSGTGSQGPNADNSFNNIKEGPYSVIAKNRLTGCISAPANNTVPDLRVYPDLTPSSTGSTNCIVDPVRNIQNNGTATVTVGVTAGPHTFQWYTGTGDPILNALPVLGAGHSETSATATFLGGPVGDPHSYTVLVKDTPSGCTSYTTALVADQSVVPVLTPGAIAPNTICAPPVPFDGSITVQISNIGATPLSNFEFSWFDDAAMTVSHTDPNLADPNVLTVLEHEDYTVTVENTTTGCVSDPLTAQVPDGRINPALSITTTGSHNCTNGAGIDKDGTATVAITNNILGDGMSFLWTSVGATTAINGTNTNTSATATHLGGPDNAPNTYNVLVTNTRTKCFSNGQGLVADLSVKPVPVLAAFVNHVCDPALITQTTADHDGHVDVTSITHPIGATGPADVVYQWRNVSALNVVGAVIIGETALSLANIPAGKYASVVTISSLGCTSDPVIEEVIDDLDAPVLVQDSDPNTICPDGVTFFANGMAEIETADGNALPNANYTLQWFDGAIVAGAPRPETTPILGSQITSGTFTAEVTNRTTGCKASEPITVVDARVIPSVAVSVVSNNLNCTGTPNGALLATPSNAGASFSVSWTPAPIPLPALPQKVSGAGNINYTALPAGPYSATVTNTATGCVSPSDGQNIIDQFTYPAITFTTVAQTSCNVAAPNGSITANDPGGRSFSWYTGIGTASPLSVDAGDPANLIDNLSSNDYTLEVTINATGCKSTNSEFVPNMIVQPTVGLANTKPVEICGPTPSGMTPDGEVTVTLGGISAAPNFTVFYVRTQVIGPIGAGSYPTNPSVIKLSPETYVGGANPPLVTGLSPGYFTALVVDNNTSCESVPQTVQVIDATADYTFQILGVATAGLCDPVAPGGQIDLTVNKDGAPCVTCTYQWYASTPTNSNINFFNNPPNIPPPVITTDLDLGVVNPAGGVSAGDYTIVVFDTDNGCGDYHVENIPTSNPALVVVTPDQPTECVNASNLQNNGSIEVQVTRGLGNIDGYTVNIYQGNAASGVPLISEIANTTSPFTVTLNNLDNGDYFIEVIDEFAPNTACPQGFQETLVSEAFNPVVTIDQITPNTSCDPNTSADGKVELTVTKDGLDTSPDQDYFITSIIPAPVVPVPGGLPIIVGSGNSGASITIDGFEPLNVEPTYLIRVVDNISSCFKDVTVSIPDAQDLPSALNLALNPETNCSNALANNSNGSALVSLTDPLETEDIFDFTWDNDNTLATPVYSSPGDNAQLGGELLNQSKVLAANWAMGPLGQGSGNRTFFVQGIKNANAPTGVGCKTALLQVVIPDQHISPDITLTPFFDSFCQADALNNQVGDGRINVVADANPTAGGQQIPVGGFNYEWTPLPIGSLTGSPDVSAVASYDINQLHDGNYTVTVTNPVNACIVQNQTTISPAPYVLSIENALVTDQRICNNDGRIEVTQIVLTDNSPLSPESENDNTAALIDSKYTFQWYNNAALTATTELEDAITPDDITHKVLGHDEDGDFTAEEDDYGLMQAGTYYVVATRTNPAQIGFGCPTLPFQVVVNDVHVNPVPTLQALSNTSCLPAGPGEGQINITMTDNTPAPFNANVFNYTWGGGGPIPPSNPNPTNNADGDGLGADDQFINLIDNVTLGFPTTPYTVSILNTVTGCTTGAQATIVKNATPVFVQNVVVTPEILCSPTGDGSITVTRVTLNDRNGNEEEFVPAPGAGQGNITDFNFTWRKNGDAFVQGPTAGNILDVATYDAVAPGFSTPIGAGTYTVVASRAAGSPGAGCPSAPFEVVISDQRINPVVSLTPFANTSCATLPGDMEGEIEVRVTDATTAPGVTGFTYNWTLTPALTPIGAGAGDGDGFGGGENDGFGIDNDNDHPVQLSEGGYAVTVTSDKSGCVGTGTTTIIKNQTPIFVQDVAVLNQILCGPDGQLTVQTITLNDRNGVTQTFPPNISDFEFTWTRTGIAGSQLTVGTVLNPGNYVPANFAGNAFGLGEYTVVATRTSNGPGNGCSSAPYSVPVLDRRIFPVVTLTPFANTSCSILPAQFEGEIEVDVTDATPAGFALGYDYTWNAGTGTAIVSANTANNGNGDSSDGDDDNPTTLQEGVYNITVLNNASSCSSTAQTEIYKNSTPVFTQLVTATDQVLCAADGRLVVNEVRVIDRDQNVQSSLTDFPISDFDFAYSRGADVPSAVLIPGVTGTDLNNINYGAIGADTYFVVARRVSGGPGLDCTSPPYKVDILNKQLFPVVSLTPFANTSCDPTFFEGEIEVRVTDNSVNLPAPLTGAPFLYNYNWTTSATPAVISGLIAGNNDGDGDGADGDADHPMTLEDGAYVVQVRNTQTNCISTGSTTIFKNSTPVFTQLVTPVHQIVCNPDGSLTVNEVKVIDRDGNVESNVNGDFPLSDFSFTYNRGSIGNAIAPPVTAPFLNNVNYPTIGIDDYYVIATRVAGGPGLNCSSAPYKVSIEDRRDFPTVSFTSLANSSCNVAMPNGSVTANAAEADPAIIDAYTFGWTLNGGLLSPASSVSNPTPRQSIVANALDGAYVVTATNTRTGCPFDASFNLKLDQTMSTPNIIKVDVDHPEDCQPSATAMVTEITLGSTTNSVLFPPNLPPNNVISGTDLLNFTFSWYQGGTGPANQLPSGGPFFTTPCIGPDCVTPTTGLTAGKYFVTVLDPNTDCQSEPKELIVNDDEIIYPIIEITQTKLQVSCISGVGSAELQATADGFDGTNPNYVFEWFRNLDATPPPDQTGSTFGNLVPGNYSVEVLDQLTACKAEQLYIIPDDAELFKPGVSLSSDPRFNCLQPDGLLLARELNFNPNRYPFPAQDFTAEIYTGLNADVTVPGAIMPVFSVPARTWLSTGLDVGTYTVKITDNNTGCTTTNVISLSDGRTPPAIVIIQENPLVNCDPARPNGQLSATADGGLVGGYAFDWYQGTVASGTSLGTNNVVSGLGLGAYTVRVTNDLTGCFEDETGDIKDGRVKAPTPDAEVKAHRTHCIYPDGWVTASVEGVTISYNFEWFDGETDFGNPDFIGPDYLERAEGFYTVKAMDRITGCYSNPVSVEVLNKTEIPDLVFTTTASFCEDLPDNFSKGNGSVQVDMVPAYLFTDSIAWVQIEQPAKPLNEITNDDEGSLINLNNTVYTGAYVTDLFPGFYKSEVTTVKGCRNWGVAEVKTEIKAYNLVTRNSDGKNDAFVIDCISRFPDNNVKIFNRAGVKVYEENGYDNADKVFRGLGENGVYTTGNDLPVGTYFYIIDKRDGSKPRTGYLELVK